MDTTDMLTGSPSWGLHKDIINPFKFIKNKQLVFPPLKKNCYMFSEGNAAHPVGCDSPLQIVMVIWRPFLI
jgi:hypothetical protein